MPSGKIARNVPQLPKEGHSVREGNLAEEVLAGAGATDGDFVRGEVLTPGLIPT